MKHKVVYSARYGGFGLSQKAAEMLNELKGEKVCDPNWGSLDANIVPRHDKDLIAVVEKLGSEEASSRFAKLCVAEINTNCYRIDEYDGFEDVQVPDDIDWVVIS